MHRDHPFRDHAKIRPQPIGWNPTTSASLATSASFWSSAHFPGYDTKKIFIYKEYLPKDHGNWPCKRATTIRIDKYTFGIEADLIQVSPESIQCHLSSLLAAKEGLIRPTRGPSCRSVHNRELLFRLDRHAP